MSLLGLSHHLETAFIDLVTIVSEGVLFFEA